MIKKYNYNNLSENCWYSKTNYDSIIMEYQKIINLLENTRNQLGKFRIKYYKQSTIKYY